jgi:hypothetical protein
MDIKVANLAMPLASDQKPRESAVFDLSPVKTIISL